MMRTLLTAVIALALAAPAAAATRRDRLLVSADWLAKHLNDPDLVILQVGDKAAYDKAHIPGALLLNLYEWEDLMFPVVEVLDADELRRTIIIYCDAQKCATSRQLRDKLNELPLGERDIRILHGGWPAWKAWKPTLAPLT